MAGLLKGYLREIAECVFTTEGMENLLEAHDKIKDEENKIRVFNRILYKLPATNRNCVEFLINHLNRVSQMEKQNKMNVENVAKIFGPTMLHYGRDVVRTAAIRPKDIVTQGDIVAFIIEEHKQLFQAG